jgi:N-acetylmuramoyl-L-alanine amidase
LVVVEQDDPLHPPSLAHRYIHRRDRGQAHRAARRGVAILTPVADGPNDRVISSSNRFGRILLRRYTALTGIPISNYDGSGGFAPRKDLAGLNLTTVPKVLIECVNMRNAADAARLVKPSFQRLAAKSMAEAITGFLKSR